MQEQFLYGPTFAEMLEGPSRQSIPGLGGDLFDITWNHGRIGMPRHLVLPPALTSIDASLIVLLGSGFPTGSHKVGAAYAVAMTQQLFGGLRPDQHRLIWPSTGNYGIGGSWVGAQLGYQNAVVMPAGMSEERYQLLRRYGAEIIATPGAESNVREVYDRCDELAQAAEVRVLNQFSDMANYRFHYFVTGNSILALMARRAEQGEGDGGVSAFVAGMGSAGTMAAGDRIKQAFPGCLIVGLEPLQCPTLYANGYGTHAIEGMGDKHVTWIHNVGNMDGLICIDEKDCLEGLYVLASENGQKALVAAGVSPAVAAMLGKELGISGVCNILGALKAARHWGLGAADTVVTVATDGLDRYHSVMARMRQCYGELGRERARWLLERIFHSSALDHIQEGTVEHRRRWHNLKYFTWVEQRGKTLEQLEAQRDPAWWTAQQVAVEDFDRKLEQTRGTGPSGCGGG